MDGNASTAARSQLETTLGGADLAVLVIYLASVLGVGLWASIRGRHDSTSDYFLGGRNMNWVLVGASLFASNVGTDHFVGLAGSGAATGIGIAGFELNALFIVLLLAWVFVPVYLASGVFTMPEYLRKRFGGQRIRIYLALLALLSYVFTKISTYTLVHSLSKNRCVGISMHLLLFCWASLLFQLSENHARPPRNCREADDVTGGLSAVLWIDFVQAVIMIGGASVLAVIGDCAAVAVCQEPFPRKGRQHLDWLPQDSAPLPHGLPGNGCPRALPRSGRLRGPRAVHRLLRQRPRLHQHRLPAARPASHAGRRPRAHDVRHDGVAGRQPGLHIQQRFYAFHHGPLEYPAQKQGLGAGARRCRKVLCGGTRGGEHRVDPGDRGFLRQPAVRLHPEREQLLGAARLRRLRARHRLGAHQRAGRLLGPHGGSGGGTGPVHLGVLVRAATVRSTGPKARGDNESPLPALRLPPLRLHGGRVHLRVVAHQAHPRRQVVPAHILDGEQQRAPSGPGLCTSGNGRRRLYNQRWEFRWNGCRWRSAWGLQKVGRREAASLGLSCRRVT
ncbi:uncharacterized protein LOC144165167 isoform X5 [Haemaphysalis longicornis]